MFTLESHIVDDVLFSLACCIATALLYLASLLVNFYLLPTFGNSNN
jgi:hypothetical protein